MGHANTQDLVRKALTLGDVLYAGPERAMVPEDEWANLVCSIAAGDQLALHALYERSHRIVFTLLLRITANREMAEEIMIDVFHAIWRGAGNYDAQSGTVLGWIMEQARKQAVDRLRFENYRKRGQGGAPASGGDAAPDPRDVQKLGTQREALCAALDCLTPDERLAIETTFFAGLTQADAAARLNQPLGTIKTRIRSGLLKLRHALAAGMVQP